MHLKKRSLGAAADVSHCLANAGSVVKNILELAHDQPQLPPRESESGASSGLRALQAISKEKDGGFAALQMLTAKYRFVIKINKNGKYSIKFHYDMFNIKYCSIGFCLDMKNTILESVSHNFENTAYLAYCFLLELKHRNASFC